MRSCEVAIIWPDNFVHEESVWINYDDAEKNDQLLFFKKKVDDQNHLISKEAKVKKKKSNDKTEEDSFTKSQGQFRMQSIWICNSAILKIHKNSMPEINKFHRAVKQVGVKQPNNINGH